MSREAKEVALAAINAVEKLESVSKFIPKAIAEHPNLQKTLQSHDLEVRKAKRVVNLIHEQEGLQTSGVVAGLRKLDSLGAILKTGLLDIGGDKDERTLEHAVRNLSSERRGLTTLLRLAGVGLVKTDGVVKINTKVVNSTDAAVKKAFGGKMGLHITSFVTGLNRNPDATGNIRLTEREYESLSREQIQIAHPEIENLSAQARTRILCNCLARDQSIQILGPVGEDMWRDIAFIKVEGLVATDNAIQFGYPVMLEVFRESLDRQERRVNSNRVTA